MNRRQDKVPDADDVDDCGDDGGKHAAKPSGKDDGRPGSVEWIRVAQNRRHQLTQKQRSDGDEDRQAVAEQATRFRRGRQMEFQGAPAFQGF